MSVSFSITLTQRCVQLGQVIMNPPSDSSTTASFAARLSSSLFLLILVCSFHSPRPILCTWTLAILLPRSLCLLHPEKYQGPKDIRKSSLTDCISVFLHALGSFNSHNLLHLLISSRVFKIRAFRPTLSIGEFVN